MKKFVSGLFAVVLLGGAFASAQEQKPAPDAAQSAAPDAAQSAAPDAAQEDTWKEYVYPNDGFAISSAVEPGFETRPVYVYGGTANAHIYTIPATENSVFMVFIFQRHRLDKRSEKKLNEDLQKGAIEPVRGKMSKKTSIELSRYRGAVMEIEASHPELGEGAHNVSNRYFFVGRFIYHLMVVAPKNEPFPADTARWFNSFRVVKRTPTEQSQ